MGAKQLKLEEARFFLDKMRSNTGNQYEFNNNLSAYLTAARSVMQYIYKEVKGISISQKWYDDCVSSNQDLAYLKDIRDINVHEKPVSTIKHASSNGTRSHYFNTDYTKEDVLALAHRQVDAISKLIEEGMSKGYISD